MSTRSHNQTEGFPGSILTLMDVDLPCPDHTTLSRRSATVAIRRQADCASAELISLIVDSTGLKVCGQGEWQAQRHGEKKVKRWKQLPRPQGLRGSGDRQMGSHEPT